MYKLHGTGIDINGNMMFDAAVGKEAEELVASLKGYKDALGEVKTAREDNNRLLEASLSYESRYLQMQDDFTNGDYDKVAEGYAKVNSGFITASTGAREELKNQVSDFKEQYENLLELSKKSPDLVTDEQLQQAKYLWEQAMIELEKTTVEHTESIHKTLFDSAIESAKNYCEGLAEGLELNKDLVIASATDVGNVVSEAVNRSLVIRSPSRVGMKSGMYYDEGFALGIEKGIPDVSAISSDMANAAVSSTLGIMHAQGASSIAPYNPVFQQAYSAPKQDSTPTATPSSSPQQTGGDIIIPISIGDETIETVVVNAVTRANAASGGWSV